METYQINDLERITGIKAHTIRIWEKRYNLITPHRTATNIRYYDDTQVRKLLNVSTLIGQGYKISEITALNDKQITAYIDSIHSEDATQTDAICAVFINDLIAATLNFNEAVFEKTFSAAVTRLGMYHTIMEVVYPFLKKVGILWSSDKMASIQEHFSTNIIRRKLIAAIDGLAVPHRKSKKFLLFLPPDEWHEIALLFSDYLIRSAGYVTIYLGQNVPYNSLALAIKDAKPTHLLTFYVSRRAKEEISSSLKNILKKNKGIHILIGGNTDLLGDISFPTGVAYLSSPDDLLTHT